MVNKIKTSISKIEKILHISDVHIRLQKRQDEYRIVFKRLYTFCKTFVETNPNTLIFLGGDIVHTKTDMSPEQADLLQDFLKSLSDITDTILITGNHDCNLNNRSRLDSLQPVVNALNHPQLHYLKESGIYEICDVSFVVMSVFDRPSNFTKASEVDAKYKIALHHGPVHGSHTALGFQLTNESVNLETFTGYDLTLLGDIHLLQHLQQYSNNSDIKTPAIAYPSSLLQQDFGETLYNHGLLIWDLETRTSLYHEIQNDYGYVTVDIDNGVILNEPSAYPKHTRLKLKFTDTPKSVLQEILSNIRQRTDVQSISTQKHKQYVDIRDRQENLLVAANIGDVEVQNELICDHLEKKHGIIDQETFEGVRYINRLLNTKLQIDDVIRQSTYIIKKLEFSNVFAYGPDNSINFENMTGIYGLFAHNRSGKSSILDALLFCLFDKCTKTSSANHVLNNKSTSFKLLVEFELNRIQYYIERNGVKRDRDNHVRVNVDFYYFDDLGNKVSLNGKERTDTNKIIKKYIGAYEDFILTSLSPQNNNIGFIDMTQRDRKELLSQFLDIGRFDMLYKLAMEEIKGISAELRVLQKQDISKELSENTMLLETSEKLHDNLDVKIQDMKVIEQHITSDVLELTKQLIITNADKLSLTQINSNISKLEDSKESLRLQYINTATDFEKLKLEINNVTTKISVVNIDDIKLNVQNRNIIVGDIAKNKTILADFEIHASHMKSKLDKLTDLKYDTNCTYCMDNIFVKDAINTKDEYTHIQKQINDISDVIQLLDAQLIENDSHIALNEYTELQNTLTITKQKYSKLELQIEKLKADILNVKFGLDTELNNKVVYQTNLDIINNNKILESQITIKNAEVLKLRGEITKLESQSKQAFAVIESCKYKLLVCNTNLVRLNKLEREVKQYELYLLSTTYNGVPYDIISKTLPQIESEINNVLGQLVDFSITLYTDDKNINAYIVYDDDNYWPIELVSGMEKFIASLAIRVSLVNITSLPKPNFLSIDEGFTQLDSENMSSVYMLFNYLKSQFDFIIIISHLDIMRDMVDKFLDIQRVNGFSKISVL